MQTLSNDAAAEVIVNQCYDIHCVYLKCIYELEDALVSKLCAWVCVCICVGGVGVGMAIT